MSDKLNLSLAIREAAELEQELIELGGELTPELEARAKAVELTLPAAVDREVEFLDKCEGAIEWYKQKAKRFTSVAQSIDKFIKMRKEVIKSGLLTYQIDKIEGEENGFYLRNTRKTVVVTDLQKIPKEYLKIEANLSALYDDLSAGKSIPGAELKENKALYKGAKKRG